MLKKNICFFQVVILAVTENYVNSKSPRKKDNLFRKYYTNGKNPAKIAFYDHKIFSKKFPK